MEEKALELYKHHKFVYSKALDNPARHGSTIGNDKCTEPKVNCYIGPKPGLYMRLYMGLCQI
jgi:hypothetical protein